MSEGGRPCVFFDRDGVVNRSPGPGYVLSPDQFHLHAGIAEALRVVHSLGALAIVATSQKGVGKGLMSLADLQRIHRRMADLLEAEGEAFDGVYAHTGLGDAHDHPPKPDPGMLLAAARDWSIDLGRSWLVGDADRDIEMGRAAGLAGTIRVLGENPINIAATFSVESTTEIPEVLRSVLEF